MSVAVKVDIRYEDLGAGALLESLLTPAFIHGANQVAGRGAANAVQAHLRGLESERPNRLGGRRSHYWSHAAQSVQHTVDPEGARVSIAHIGMALHYFGGTVLPVNADNLAIPAKSQAHGRRPRDADNPELALTYRRRRSDGALIKALADTVVYSKRGRARGTGDIWYWLVKSATIQADPTVLPPEQDIKDAGQTAVESYINRHIDRARQRAWEARQ